MQAHALSLVGLPANLTVGTPLSPVHEATIAALFAHGVLPAVPRKAGDTSSTYTLRALRALGAQHEHLPISLGLIVEGDILYADISADHNSYSAEAFEQALSRASRPLCAALFRELESASFSTLPVYGPGRTLMLAEQIRFGYDLREWWSMRADDCASELGIDTPTGAQFRKWLRDSDIRTPGWFYAALGRHHDPNRKTIGIAACHDLLPTLPRRLRGATAQVLASIARLDAVDRRVRSMRTTADVALAERFEESETHPGVLIETTGRDLCYELVNELWQFIAQQSDFASNRRLVLTPRNGERLARTVDAFAEAHDALEDVRVAITSFGSV